MILKIALTNPCPINLDKDNGLTKLASGRVIIEPGSDKEKIIQAEIKKHPNALFFRAKAIKADEANSNGDYFSKEELKKAYKTFEGVPFFTNHENQDIEKAKGKIIFAEWVEEENSVYTIAFVDRDAYPHICRGIQQGYMSGVSMGASVEYSVCNICNNRAERTEDFCGHIKDRKSRKFSGKARDVKTGEIKEFKDQLVFEYNHGIKFIELSGVVDPACPSCHIEGIIENNQYLNKVANIENTLRMVKVAALDKKASQEEIQQINDILGTLEDMAVNLIKNRQQVEVEFASELVDIIANLQTWLDELVGAGYGNIQTNVPGTDPSQAPAGQAPTDQAPADQNQEAATAPRDPSQAPPVAPVASEGAMSVGQTTGDPNKALVSPPVRPAMPASSQQIIKVSEQFEDRMDFGDYILQKTASLCDKFNKTGARTMSKRRTLASKEQQKQRTKEILSNSWQEKQNFFQYIKEIPNCQEDNFKVSVKNRDDSFVIVAEDSVSDRIQIWSYDDLTEDDKDLISQSPKKAAQMFLGRFANNKNKEGVERMDNNIKEAGANTVLKTPEVTTESQLDQKDIYHPRTNSDQHSTTQQQLENSRTNKEPQQLTEKQLESIKLNPRQNKAPEVVTQAQLDNERTGEDIHTTTQNQLNPNRTNNEPNVITQKQLDSVDSPWARQANRNPKNFKTAKQHMDEVVKAFASVSIETGATPKEVQLIARELVANTKARYNFANALLATPDTEKLAPFSTRVAFWNSKNVKVATASPTDVETSLVNALRIVASDETTDPEMVISGVDVISEDEDGEKAISEEIDAQLSKVEQEVSVVASSKEDLRKALKASSKKEVVAPQVTLSAKEQRDLERKAILASLDKEVKTASTKEDPILNREKLNGADTVIETSFKEVGTKQASPTFRRDIVSFAKGALAGNNMKLASVTNVTISGDTIQIAVQTDAGEESVEIPIGQDNSPSDQEVMPEGDLSGEGAEMAPPAPATASRKNRMSRQAQSPMGGGAPGAGAGMTPPAAGGGTPMGAAPPADDPALQALTTDEGEGQDDEVPTVGEKQYAWSICPECGSADVDVTKDEQGGIAGSCNGCGAEYEALVKKTVEFTIIKPTKSTGEEGEETPDEPEAPEEMPALPVAAQTKLNKGSMIRIAKNQKQNGHVCPSCGKTHCEVVKSKGGSTHCVCQACDSQFTKNIILSKTNPKKGLLRVEWSLIPSSNCKECKEEAKKFASKIKVNKLLRTASSNASSFPMSSCMERLAMQYGGNTKVASFGPCKGKPLAECVCKELQKLGFTKVRQMTKLAEASMQKDPMDECIKDQKKKGHNIVEATSICGCIKKKFASTDADNIYIHAFGEEAEQGKVPFNMNDLSTLGEIVANKKARIEKIAQAAIDNQEIGDPLGSVDVAIDDQDITDEDVTNEAKTITITGTDVEIAVDGEVVGDEVEGEGDENIDDVAIEGEMTPQTQGDGMQENLDDVMAMSSSKVKRTGAESSIRIAGKPKQISTIENNVESGVPRNKGTIKNEGPSNIDVPLNKPKVPRGNATMGNEQPLSEGLPDVPVDSSYMGVEKAIQQRMPAINNEIKGTVIATKLKEVDTVEKNVKVPRGNATMGNEGKGNIDVAMDKPSVPRGSATMGNEGKDNIDVSMDSPDVPMGDAYLGGEKDAQKGLPANNDQVLKQVQMKRDQQLEKLSSARKEEARNTAAWLASNGRIASDKATFDNVVTALSSFEVDKISTIASTMFPEKIKTASTDKQVRVAGTGLPAIILDSAPKTEQTFAERIASSFTVGSVTLNQSLGENK